jgi:hypothetical protein
VVNPLGVAEPTVGWKRVLLSVVVPTSGVISDKYFHVLHLEIYILIYIYTHSTVRL